MHLNTRGLHECNHKCCSTEMRRALIFTLYDLDNALEKLARLLGGGRIISHKFLFCCTPAAIRQRHFSKLSKHRLLKSQLRLLLDASA